MRRTWGVVAVCVTVVFGLRLGADEKAPESYSTAMKSAGATAAPLRMKLMATPKDFDAIAKDAATFKTIYATALDYWSQKKVDDAIGMAKAAATAAADLETAAKAKNEEGVTATGAKVVGACAACHMAHRSARLPDGTYEIK